jgi:putative endonuclease
MDLAVTGATGRNNIFVHWRITDLVRSIVDRFYPWDRRPCPAWTNTRRAGNHGERIAARYVQRTGVKILVRNYRTRTGEIDLIGRDRGELVMIEVKTRHYLARNKPQDSVTWEKQRRIIATANQYLRELSCRPPPVRFDIIEVLFAPRLIPRCRWIQHAFTLNEAGVGWSR